MNAKRMQAAPAAAAGARREQEAGALLRIADATDSTGLRTLMANARRLGSDVVYAAAFRRLAEIAPEAEPGSEEHDFRRTTAAYATLRAEAGGPAERAARAGSKAARAGERGAVEDYVMGPAPAEGFRALIALGFPELTAEAVVLRHPAAFGEPVRAAARRRLADEGVDVESLPANP